MIYYCLKLAVGVVVVFNDYRHVLVSSSLCVIGHVNDR